MKILALVSDAYGGHGGIATFNRSFLSAIAAMDEVEIVKVLPRIIEQPAETPNKLTQDNAATEGIVAYTKALRHAINKEKFDLIICGHINLLPFAKLAQLRKHCPVVLNIHGIDVDEAKKRFGLRYLAQRIDAVISVSKLTLERFQNWAPLKMGSEYILSNSVDLNRFTPEKKPEALLKKYHLNNKQVLLTLGRLAGRDREKGFDEVLEVLPELLKTNPNLIYIIAGDGKDRQRLEKKAKDLGLKDKVIFTGRISETEKVDHYRLADLYVMPSKGEGFGIVILEALACGIPVIGSTKDGTREALLDGKLGKLVDPDKPAELIESIRQSLNSTEKGRPEGLEVFNKDNFIKNTQEIVRKLKAKS